MDLTGGWTVTLPTDRLPGEYLRYSKVGICTGLLGRSFGEKEKEKRRGGGDNPIPTLPDLSNRICIVSFLLTTYYSYSHYYNPNPPP